MTKNTSDLIIKVNCLALTRKLRAAYWCVEIDESDLLKLTHRVHRLGLDISTQFPRLIYNRSMTNENDLNTAFADVKSIFAGKLLGYPSPGEDRGEWWVSWQFRVELSKIS